MYGSMFDLRSMRKGWTAAAQRASSAPPILLSLGMAVAFVCWGCVDLTKPWERTGRLDAAGTGGLGGNGLTATGGGGQTVTTFPSGLDGGNIVDGGGSDQAALGGSGDTAMPGAGGDSEVGSGGADGMSTGGTGEAWDAGSGGMGSTTPDVGLAVQTGGSGGVAIDGAGRYYVDNRPVPISLADLRSRIRSYAEQSKQPIVRIRGDAKVPYEKIVQLMDELKKANLLKFTFDTQTAD